MVKKSQYMYLVSATVFNQSAKRLACVAKPPLGSLHDDPDKGIEKKLQGRSRKTEL